MKIIIAVLLVLLILLQVRLWHGDGGIVEVMSLHDQVVQQETQVSHLKDRNQQLAAEVQDLKNRLDALEERARSDLGMVKKGETFYQDAG